MQNASTPHLNNPCDHLLFSKATVKRSAFSRTYAFPCVRSLNGQGTNRSLILRATHDAVNTISNMSDYYWSNTFEVIGDYTRVQRVFDQFYSLETVPCEGGGAALNLERVFPIPDLLRGTHMNDLEKHIHALHVMPSADLDNAPWYYRSLAERDRIHQEFTLLSESQREEGVRIALERDVNAYQVFGALDEDDWCRRFWGCYQNTYSRQGGLFEPDQRGVRLWCRFSTEVGWPKSVLEHLVRTHADLTFINEATDWTGQKVFMIGSAGSVSYSTVPACHQEEF